MLGVTTALRDQTNVLERVETEIGGLGAEVEEGVMRGLAGALGGSGSGPQPENGKQRPRPGKSSAVPYPDGEHRVSAAPRGTGKP